jgi:hypothetical protein
MRTRRLIFAALVAGLPLAAAVNAPAGTAATCAETRLYIDGNQTGGNNCYYKHQGDICQHVDITQSVPTIGLDDTGAGASVCVNSPVLLH